MSCFRLQIMLCMMSKLHSEQINAQNSIIKVRELDLCQFAGECVGTSNANVSIAFRNEMINRGCRAFDERVLTVDIEFVACIEDILYVFSQEHGY